MAAVRESAREAFESHRGYLWSVAYRMLGCAADADEVLQDTFVRALESPPRRTALPWRPWLTRVAVNLARDRLRSRKRARYVGPWLPSPVEHDPIAELSTAERQPTPAARFDLRESASFAFLLALEALTPNQRAVLLMRDVLDASLEETADVLGLSVANVKVSHHRARKRLASYEQERRTPSAARDQQAREALARFMTCLATGDLDGLQAMLAEDARLVSDGGGEFFAARVPVVGPAKIVRFLANVMAGWAADTRYELRELNGSPAVSGEASSEPPPGYPRRFVSRLELDREGRIREIHTVLATRKLTSAGFDATHR